jgi:hypothetical protein
MLTQASRPLSWTEERPTLTLIRGRRPAPRFPWALPGEAAPGLVAIGTWLGLWWWFLAATW